MLLVVIPGHVIQVQAGWKQLSVQIGYHACQRAESTPYNNTTTSDSYIRRMASCSTTLHFYCLLLCLQIERQLQLYPKTYNISQCFISLAPQYVSVTALSSSEWSCVDCRLICVSFLWYFVCSCLEVRLLFWWDPNQDTGINKARERKEKDLPLRLAATVLRLEEGVSVGNISSVTMPPVFFKAQHYILQPAN